MTQLDSFSIDLEQTLLIIFAEGELGKYYSKAAMSVLRYGKSPIVAVIDSSCAGKSIKEVTGIDHKAPIVSSFEEAMQLGEVKALLIGIAFAGGALPEICRNAVKNALSNKLHVISGFHHFLNDDPELNKLAEKNQVLLWDVRNPDLYRASNSNTVAKQRQRPDGVKVITMVGSDCSTGKMTTALELVQVAQDQGVKAEFIATGQNGIMVSGNGIPLDGVAGDFMAGSVENAIFETIEAKSPELIIVEGQGSLVHPGFSGVTLSLLHGSNPDYMILCHNPERETANGDYKVKLPSLSKLVDIYEEAANWTLLEGKESAKVIGIALNTKSYSEEEGRELVNQAEAETKLPATDSVRFGVEELIRVIRHECLMKAIA